MTKYNFYVDWKGWHRKLSRKIWSNIWIRTDDVGWYLDLIGDALWIGTICLIMLSWHNLKCYVDWKWCDRKLSRQIWSNIWIRTDDGGLYFHLIWDALWIGTNCLIMLSWHNLKCYVDWKWRDRVLSRQIWNNMWNRTADIGWCHDLSWGDMWIGTNDRGCCHDQF
jgi:hypothetical protein